MTVSIERAGPVWTIIHDRPEARNAMDTAKRGRADSRFSGIRCSQGGLGLPCSTVRAARSARGGISNTSAP